MYNPTGCQYLVDNRVIEMAGMRQKMELEKKFSDFMELLQRINDLLKYYPWDSSLSTIRDLLEEAIRAIEEERQHLDRCPTQESSSI